MAEGSGETSRLGGSVFVLPGGHKSRKSKEWAALSSMSLVLCVHYMNRKKKQVKTEMGKNQFAKHEQWVKFKQIYKNSASD